MEINLIEIVLKMLVALGLPLGMIPIIVHVERRGAAFIQRRLGPNRVGPFGILQPLADVVKFLFKEDVQPAHVRSFYYQLAPLMALFFAIIPLAGLPICEPILIEGRTIYPEVFHSHLGIFYVFAAAALASYGILLGGWSSNNKYSLLGAIRAAAQMISYELGLSIVLVTLFFIYGTFDLHQIIQKQNGVFIGFIPRWGIFFQPVAALIFLVCIFAESNRIPFDLAEGESEIVAGYHIEYSAIKFALFFMAEYLHIIVLSTLFVMLFMGGYNLLPGMIIIVNKLPNALYFLQGITLILKVAFMVWLFIWVRWSLPRFRYDQLMDLGWKKLLPLGIVNLIVTVIWTFIRN